METSMDGSNHSQGSNNLAELNEELKKNLEIKDRKYLTKTYKQCFLHSHAVQHFTIQHGMDEATAVATLNELREAGYLQHVVDPKKPFRVNQRAKLYFCFLDDPKSHVQQKAKSNTKKFMKHQKLTPQMLADVLMGSPEYQKLKTQLTRLESNGLKSSNSAYATGTKLEIVHQATISLIQTMVATAVVLLVILAHTLYAVVPRLDQTQPVMLLTSLAGTLLVAAYVSQGMSLWTVWLQLDTCVVQAAEGEDAVEDYEVDMMSVASGGTAVSTLSGVPCAPNPRPPMLPKPPALQKRQSSLFLKEPLLRKSHSTVTRSSTATKNVQQRQPSDLPPPSQWPHRPVLVCANTPTDASLNVPQYGTGPCPIGKPFKFSSDLFEGECLVRLKGIPNSDCPEGDEAYFSSRRRLFQTIIQGRFKEPLKVGDVLTGHEFVQPLQNLPHPWILKAATNLIGKLAPGAEIQVVGDHPTMLASLAATSQVVRGDEPGNEPDIDTTDDIEEDCSLLGGKFSSGTISSGGRKLHLASPTRAANYTFDTETVYTFDFYQSLLNCCTYSLDLGIANIGMAPVLNGQPIQSLCKTTDGRYLWSFQIWHENLLPKEMRRRESSKGKKLHEE